MHFSVWGRKTRLSIPMIRQFADCSPHQLNPSWEARFLRETWAQFAAEEGEATSVDYQPSPLTVLLLTGTHHYLTGFLRNKQTMLFPPTSSLGLWGSKHDFLFQVHVEEHWLNLGLANGSSAQTPIIPAPRAASSSHQGRAIQLHLDVLAPWILQK